MDKKSASHRLLPTLLVIVLGSAGARKASAESVSLADALGRAGRAGFAVRAAQADLEARQAQAREALGGLLPGVRAELGYARTNDPLAVFGATLRQGEVAPADFDPRRLNDPAPRNNVGAALIAEVPLVNLDAWAGRSAAAEAANAAGASAEWAREQALIDVVKAYYAVALARAQTQALESGLAAATGHLARARALARAGTVTEADALLAAVKVGELEVRLAEAQAGAADAARGLAVAVGESGEVPFEPRSPLPDDVQLERLSQEAAVTPSAGPRGDLRAAGAQARAAQADSARSYAALLPRLNAMGRLDWNHEQRPFGGETAWTVGLMATWAPFTGGRELAAAQAASARARAAGAMAEAARASAHLSTARAAAALGVSVARLRATQQAVEQSSEAHRIVGKKYEGGLSGVTELLDAAATETASRLGAADARYRIIVAAAELRAAVGQSVESLADILERP